MYINIYSYTDVAYATRYRLNFLNAITKVSFVYGSVLFVIAVFGHSFGINMT